MCREDWEMLLEKFAELVDSNMEAGEIREKAIAKIVVFHESVNVSVFPKQYLKYLT